MKRSDKMSWDLLLHGDTLFYTRINFFIIAESMLFVSFATLINSNQNNDFFSLIIVILGLFITGIWLIIGGRHRKNLETLKKRVEKYNPEYKEIRSSRIHLNIDVNRILSFHLPSSIIIFWTLLGYGVIVINNNERLFTFDNTILNLTFLSFIYLIILIFLYYLGLEKNDIDYADKIILFFYNNKRKSYYPIEIKYKLNMRIKDVLEALEYLYKKRELIFLNGKYIKRTNKIFKKYKNK